MLTPSQEAADSSIGALLQPTSSAGHDLSPQPSIDVPSLPKEDRGFESETDTEEFEKVGQSPVDPTLPAEAPPCLIQTSDKSSSQQSSTPSVQQEKEVCVLHHLVNFLEPYSPVSTAPEFTATDFYFDESLPSSQAASVDNSMALSTEGILNESVAECQLRAEIQEKNTLIKLLQVFEPICAWVPVGFEKLALFAFEC
jgi:hypothetical protein